MVKMWLLDVLKSQYLIRSPLNHFLIIEYKDCEVVGLKVSGFFTMYLRKHSRPLPFLIQILPFDGEGLASLDGAANRKNLNLVIVMLIISTLQRLQTQMETKT